MVPRGEGTGGLGKKVRGLRSTNWWLQNSHEDVKYRIKNTDNNVVIIMCGIRWGLEISGDHL